MDDIVFEKGTQIITSSNLLAEVFEKEHKNILRDIEELIKNLKGEGLELFEPSEYNDGMQRKQPMYCMNRDGFTLLAMGFTGEKAFKWKVEYLKAFNKMEKMIKEGVNPKTLATTGEVREIREYGVKVIKAVEYIEEAADEVSKELEEKMELFGKLFNEEKMKEYCLELIAKTVAGIGTLEQIESVFYNVQELKDRVKKLERGGK